jgi:hypothetical protein
MSSHSEPTGQEAVGVSSGQSGERLADKQNVSVILRLVIDEHGALVHGELVALDGTSRGRFADWPALVRLLNRLLEQV